MNVFDIITLLGGLAMFLYGMRLMGDSLKESSSGTLKVFMEKITNNVLKAFLLGLCITAIIQSSTATIVITSGLVAAGIIKFNQSIGIIMGANVGTTITGQIIRLLDIDSSATSWLEIFKPSTLAPVALIIGIILIMGFKFKNANEVGNIAIGFGILFSGLLTMTTSVNALQDTGIFNTMFATLDTSPIVGYLVGAGIAFILQSSSATIGILQAFSMTGKLTFNAICPVIVGIYLGDCVTTAIVCSIGAKEDARRVGMANILFNLTKTVIILAGVFIGHSFGLFDTLWNTNANPGVIANTNSVFNLVCAILLFPISNVYIKLSRLIIKDKPIAPGKYDDKLEALSQAFFNTPALALNACYEALTTMFHVARSNIERSFKLINNYNPKEAEDIKAEEENVDMLADRISDYLVRLSPNLNTESHMRILDHYYKVVMEFERLSDHSVNICEASESLYESKSSFSVSAQKEFSILIELITRILDKTEVAFIQRDVESARQIEPLEEVVDDFVNAMRDNHLTRMRLGKCNIYVDAAFSNLVSDLERISDVCSNIGVCTVARVESDLSSRAHSYISLLHQGKDENFNTQYNAAHSEYFSKLEAIDEIVSDR